MKFSMGFLGTSPMQISLFKEYILVTNVVAIQLQINTPSI